MTTRLLACLVLLPTMACASTTDGGLGPTAVVQGGAELTLAIGESRTVAGTTTTLAFVAVTADSRCPADTTCLWAGDAVVQLTAGSETVELHTGLPDRGQAEAAGLRLRLVALAPARTSDAAPDPAAYRVTVSVTPK